jgi:hypothetical protein
LIVLANFSANFEPLGIGRRDLLVVGCMTFRIERIVDVGIGDTLRLRTRSMDALQSDYL